jgi:predicted AAA+ superfamily ATPase
LAAAKSDPVAFIRGLDCAVIDEVQRAPDLLLAIKQSVDEDRRPGRFLLTGPANLLTVKTIHESLAGRVEVVPLYPLGRSEQLGFKHPQFIEKEFRGAVPDTAEAYPRRSSRTGLRQEVIQRLSSDIANAGAKIGTAPTSNRSSSAIEFRECCRSRRNLQDS